MTAVFPQKGYVYVLSNPSIRKEDGRLLYKVGFSNNPELRAKQLKTAGIPTPYTVELKCKTDDMKRDEKAPVHDRLAEFRDGTSECFACSLEVIKETMLKVCGIAPPRAAGPEPEPEPRARARIAPHSFCRRRTRTRGTRTRRTRR